MSDQNKEPSGLPKSSLGGLHPELRARITAASAAVRDYDREVDEYVRTGLNRPDLVSWAGRLAAELHALLDIIAVLS